MQRIIFSMLRPFLAKNAAIKGYRYYCKMDIGACYYTNRWRCFQQLYPIEKKAVN